MPSVEVTDHAGGLLQELVTKPEWLEFVPSQLVKLDCRHFGLLLKRVEEALASGTNKEKGDSLEELADFLLSSIKSFVVGLKTNTATGELDRYISVKKIPGTFLQDWSSYVPVECKNWNEPVGSSEIGDLHRKAENMRANRGILLSSMGVTGTLGTDGWGEIRNLFTREGYITLVITLEDLQKVEDGACPLKILESRQREIYLSP